MYNTSHSKLWAYRLILTQIYKTAYRLLSDGKGGELVCPGGVPGRQTRQTYCYMADGEVHSHDFWLLISFILG